MLSGNGGMVFPSGVSGRCCPILAGSIVDCFSLVFLHAQAVVTSFFPSGACARCCVFFLGLIVVCFEFWREFCAISKESLASEGCRGEAPAARASEERPCGQASSFFKYVGVCLSVFVVFFPCWRPFWEKLRERGLQGRSFASEGCRGEAPAARASEMRRDTSDTF